MGSTKKDKFSTEIVELAALAKALGHPARIAILQFLLKEDACFCGDIVEQLPLAQSTVSQHLKELKKVGLLKGSIEGTAVCYCIDPENWKKIEKNFSSFFKLLKDNNSCC
jgi:ArsR family transcriptional regulator